MYPFMTLDDNTEVVHSELLPNGTVKVYIEKPDEKDCFHSASCYLPEYEWKDVNGFNNDEIKKYQDYLETVARLIIQLAQQIKKWGLKPQNKKTLLFSIIKRS